MKKFALVVILAVATACGSAVDERFDGYISKMVSVDELLMKSDGLVSLDLRQPGIGYKLSHGTDLSRISLVCPNGVSMHMQAWMADRREEIGVSFQQLETGFVIMPAKGTQAEAAGISGVITQGGLCPEGCWMCSDGSCVCP